MSKQTWRKEMTPVVRTLQIIVPAILLILAMFAHMPTHSRLENWTENQLRLLREQSQFSR